METRQWLEKYWHILPTHFRSLIHREIEFSIANGTAGMKCDVEEWRKALKLPVDDMKQDSKHEGRKTI
jgi:hypothetical protein